MTDKELMQQALKALIWTTGSDDFGDGGKARKGALKLLFPFITALRERLEQPRQWQGLSTEEIYDMYNHPRSDAEMVEFARAIEARLKEKNA